MAKRAITHRLTSATSSPCTSATQETGNQTSYTSVLLIHTPQLLLETPTSMAAHPVFLYFFLSALLYCSAAQSPFDNLIEEKKKAVIDASNALARQLSPEAWCDAGSRCNELPCLPSACSGNSFGDDFKCSSAIVLEDQPKTCKGLDRSDEALLNLQQAFLWISADATATSGDGSNITVKDVAVRRDVCASKKFAPSLKEAYQKHNLTDWIYSGTALGVMTIFPGVPRVRSNGYSSCTFTPVTRPWYIPAASGPKDIVFLLDASTLLQSQKTLFEAFTITLNTLDRHDHVAVVIFGASTATPLGTGGSKVLQSATTATLEKLQNELDSLPLDGPPNVTLALQTAFDIHENPSASSQCSKLIVLLTGQQDSCLAECSRSESCNCLQSLRSYIDSRQEAFGETPVSLVTFTEAETADPFSANNAERMARNIVCDKSSKGIWRRVTSSDTKDTAMSSFSQITAASLFEQDPAVVLSETYIDGGGLGEIFTLSRPVYSVSEKRFLAVLGADVTVREVTRLVGDEDTARRLIQDEAFRARRCSRVTTRTSCELQTIRSQPSSAVCADILPDSRCYQRGRKVFMTFNETTSWNEAQKTCAGLGNVTATLIKIENEADNRFAAGFMNADGSWIGLRAGSDNELKWEDGSKPEYEEFAYRAFGGDAKAISTEVQNRFAGSSCATADRRGIKENWNIEPCSAKRGFVCQMTAGENVVELCGGEVFSYEASDEDPVNDVNCVALASSVRKCSDDENAKMERANPICKESNGEFTTQDRLCCGGRSDRDRSATSSGNNSGSGFEWWYAVAAIFGLALLFVLWKCCCLGVRKKKVTKKAELEKTRREYERRETMIKKREEETKKAAKEIEQAARDVREMVKDYTERSSGHGSSPGWHTPVQDTSPGFRDFPSAPPLTPGPELQEWDGMLPPSSSGSSYPHRQAPRQYYRP